MWVVFNTNPINRRVGDCVVRAISKALEKPWDTVYWDLCMKGYVLCDMPSSNEVYGAYLRDNGFTRHSIPNTCPDCYTVKDFCFDHPEGSYVLGTGSHAVAAIDGDYYDIWDSGDEVIINYYAKEVH